MLRRVRVLECGLANEWRQSCRADRLCADRLHNSIVLGHSCRCSRYIVPPDELWPVLMRYVWWVFLRRGTVPFSRPLPLSPCPLSPSYPREVHATWRHHQRMLWKNNSRNLAAAPPVGGRRPQHGIDRCRKRYCSNDDVIKPKLSPVRLRNG